ncbi:MAG: gene transfer agent family protein [Brevundimonas sp.]|nr:MAG: gene transfer agent family protein [Brevundimonas sp.]
MSRGAEIELMFGGEDRVFALTIGPLRKLQEKVDCGPMELLSRFAAGTWRVDDLRETLFQGLQGGGMSALDAGRLVKSDFDDLPYQQFVPTCQLIVTACVLGAPDESLGETQGEAQTTSPSPEEKSGSPGSTEPAPSSVTFRTKSTD